MPGIRNSQCINVPGVSDSFTTEATIKTENLPVECLLTSHWIVGNRVLKLTLYFFQNTKSLLIYVTLCTPHLCCLYIKPILELEILLKHSKWNSCLLCQMYFELPPNSVPVLKKNQIIFMDLQNLLYRKRSYFSCWNLHRQMWKRNICILLQYHW